MHPTQYSFAIKYMHVVAPSPSISPSMSWKAMGANANSDDIVGMIHNLCHNKYKKQQLLLTLSHVFIQII